MKKFNRLYVFVVLLLFVCWSFAGCEKESETQLYYIEGKEIIYLYEQVTLSQLSEAIKKNLTSKNLSSDDIISTGTVLYQNGKKYKTAVLIGDVDGNGLINCSDIVLAESVITDTISEISDFMYIAGDINADGKITWEDIEIFESCEKNTSKLSDFKEKRISGFKEDEIFIIVRYNYINPDYSVYTPGYFGDDFCDCTIYDLYAGHGLYMILTLKDNSIDNLEKQIRELSAKREILGVYKNYKDNTLALTEYKTEKHVHLLNRKYPFTKEFDGFSYNRNYRLIYYTTTNFDDLVSAEKYDEWFNYFSEMNGYTLSYSYKDKEPVEMALVSFIKYCNIPKEDFVKRIDELLKQRELHDEFFYYTEQGEIPNADILYTFNNEIIDNYYKYE